jgi:glycosyltransferase 2 family protein
MTERSKSILKWSIKMALGIGIVVYLVLRFDHQRVLLGISKAALAPFLLAFVLKLAGTFLHSVTHQVCLPAQGMKFTVFEMFRIALAVRFYSLFMPGGVSVTAIKWYKLSKSGGRRAQAAALVLFARLIHTGAALLVCGIGLTFDKQMPSTSAQVVSGVVLGVLLVVGVLLFYPPFTNRIRHILLWSGSLRFAPKFVASKVQKVWQALEAFQKLSIARILAAVGSSLAGHVIETLALYLVARSVSLDLSIFLIAWIRGIALIAGLLPLSIAGLGIREAGFVAVLRSYGIEDSVTMTFSLTYFSVALLQGLTGGVAEWWEVFGARLFGRDKTTSHPPRQHD